MLISWTLIQCDGGRLAGYGEAPTRTGTDRALLIYILAVLAVPVFYFLFVNLMNTPDPEPGSGIVGYIATLPLMAKLLFGAFLIGEIGRASCRESACQYGSISVVAVSLRTKK